MIAAVYLSIYFGLLMFAGGSAWRAWRYARLPMHLRWELYPIPHEEPLRARYGGSRFEKQENWRRPRWNHRWGELGAMAAEIFLFKSLREANRPLWLPSFLFHVGIYLEFAALWLALLSAGSARFAPVATATAIGGACLILAGAMELLIRRVSEPARRNSTSAGDVFNLLFFLAAFGMLIVGYLLRGRGTASVGELARGALHFDRGVGIGAGLGTGLILVSALAAYIPFTHMAHYVAKYFTWHAVRWDDRPCEAGSRMEREAARWLGEAPDWAAPHIGADGKRRWAEIASGAPGEVRR